MAKRLLLGRAGTGRTRRLLGEVARRIREGTDGRALLLVPTYGRGEHLKRLLLRLDEGLEGFFDRTIVTFTSLAERVLGGTPIGALLTPGVRDHLLRAALEDADPPVFRRVKGFSGFRARFLSLVKEVKEAGLDDDATAAALDALARDASGAAARARMEGFAAVFAAYTRRLRATGSLDHEDFQRRLLRELDAARNLPAALDGIEWLGVDGFHDFTRLQLRVVDLLSSRVPETVLTLPDDPDRPGLVLPSRETREHFGRAGWRGETLRGYHRALRPDGDLARLEESLFAEHPPEPRPPDGSVRVLRAADPSDEADRIARTAALWMRRDGWRPWEVLLVWRSLAAARPLLEEAFARHGVPLRVFGNRPLAAEPVVRAALDLARLALGEGDGAAALRAARSGYAAGADPSEGDRLGELAGERGVPDAPAGVGEWAAARDLPATAALLAALLPGDAEAAAAPRAPARLLAEVLAATAVPARLRPVYLPPPDRPDDLPDADRGSVEAAALEALARLAAETAASFRRRGAAAVAPADFLTEWEEAASRASFAVQDRRLHAVSAVDVEEARQWEARGVLVGGLLEKQFPLAPREDLFLRDRDRRRANEAGVLRFSERLRARDEERYLFYIACTRARERLVLSHPVAGPGGERLLPSSFLDEVLRIWPEGDRPVSESRASDPAPVEAEVLAPRDLLRGALVRVAEPAAAGTAAAVRARAAGAILESLAARAKGRVLPAVARAAALAGDPVPRLRRRRLRARFLAPYRTSASALNAFQQCPYLHFGSRVLDLASPARDAEEGLDARRLGIVVHAALEAWFRGGCAGDPGEAFDAALAAERKGIRPGLDDHALALRAREAVVEFARFEKSRVDGRAHRPEGFEVRFGFRGREGSLPPLVLAAGRRRVEVAGAFDRVDADPATGTVVVVDYKMRFRPRGFGERQLEEALDGGDIQVPLYLLAARDALGREPAGVEIAEVGAREVTGLRAPGAPESVAPGERSVALDGEGAARLEEGIRALAGDAAAALARGDIRTRPRDLDRCGAGRCDYADLCRYEKWDPRRRGTP